jgi:hypothetical protein
LQAQYIANLDTASSSKAQANGSIAATDTGDAQFRVHVSNIDFEVSESEIASLFAMVGDSPVVQIARRKTGTSNGWAHVEFATLEAATRAAELLDGTELGKHGRCIKVKLDVARGNNKKTKLDSGLSLHCRSCYSQCASVLKVDPIIDGGCTFWRLDVAQMRNCCVVGGDMSCEACNQSIGLLSRDETRALVYFRAESVFLAV